MVEKQTDILVVGGGLIGAVLMLALNHLGYSTLMVETKAFGDTTQADFDARTLALSPATQRILSMLGIWDALKDYATPISLIHVSDKHHFGASRIKAEPNNPLGYVVEIQYINKVLHQLLPKKEVLAPATLINLNAAKNQALISTQSGEVTIQAQLIVAADGTESMVRQLCALSVKSRQYNQQALVANVGLVKPHENKAYERFTSQGPLALLPMKDNRMALVWAMYPEEAKRVLALDDSSFLKELQNAFGYRLGRFVKAGTRYSYPLRQVVMPQQTQWPVVFVGNAAHTLHPVAGQGFNLGIRDVATLAQCIAKSGLTPEMLADYLQLRHHDQEVITKCTDGLIQLFTSRLPGVALARSIGLVALDNSTVLKNLLAKYARGFGGSIPDLVCEIALRPRNIK